MAAQLRYFYPLWHLEVESLLVLKNNRGVEENRVRHLDYGVQFNKLMYQRLIKGESITLFSPSDVPGLYDAFFADQDEFERLYTQYEADESIRKNVLKRLRFSAYLLKKEQVLDVSIYKTLTTVIPIVHSDQKLRRSDKVIYV